MEHRLNYYFKIIIFLIGVIILQNFIVIGQNVYKSFHEINIEIVKDSIDLTKLDLNKENFIFVCNYYEIEHPNIVYAQAQLESGHFTSKVYREKNNFLGLYDSKRKDYYTFQHWSHCLKGYKDFVQYKWDGNCNYYTFLEQLPYAADPHYIHKLKRIQNY